MFTDDAEEFTKRKGKVHLLSLKRLLTSRKMRPQPSPQGLSGDRRAPRTHMGVPVVRP